MNSVIIPVVTSDGKKTSVSIDHDLYALLEHDFLSKKDCRAWIRGQARKFTQLSGPTKNVRFCCMTRIAKPYLVKLMVDGMIDSA